MFADTVTLTIRSEPAGARVYIARAKGELTDWGDAPVTKRLLERVGFFTTGLPPFDPNEICDSLEVQVEWASGVGASQTLALCPSEGPQQEWTFTRPEGAPGREIDVAVAAKLDAAEAAAAQRQGPILHFETDLHAAVEWADANGQRWVFTLSNAGAAYFEDRCDITQLGEINWAAVQATNWSGPGVDPFVKDGKQAEFLMEHWFPWRVTSWPDSRTVAKGPTRRSHSSQALSMMRLGSSETTRIREPTLTESPH